MERQLDSTSRENETLTSEMDAILYRTRETRRDRDDDRKPVRIA